MTAAELSENLSRNGTSIVSLLTGISEEQATWRPAPEKWSLLEIVNHLCDEERDDFRRRVALTLEDPSLAWPPIDPEGWVKKRRYGDKDFTKSLKDFEEERVRSLAWLKSLDGPEWSRAYEHPIIGRLRAGDLLAAWAAHDLLHIRQIANTAVSYVSEKAVPFSTRYAAP